MRALPIVLVLLAATPTSALADPIQIGPDSPNPLITERKTVRVEGSLYTDSLGFQCEGGGGNTSKTPAATFELTADMTNLRLRLANGPYNAGIGAVLVFPGGKYLCEDDHDEFYVKRWPKGSYTLYFYGPSTELAAELHFEQPLRAKQASDDALAKLPSITLGPTGANGGANPAFLAEPATASAEAGDIGMGCGTDAHDRVFPIAKLEVQDASHYFVRVGDLRTFLITADNKCADPSDAPALAVGVHTLWGVAPKDGVPAQLSIEVDDRDRALGFGDAPRQTVGDLSKPLVLDGKVRAAERWGSREGMCRGAARAPDFYLTADQPLQKVEMSLLWSKSPEELHVFGPLSKMTAAYEVSCDEGGGRPRSYDLFEGTYAVWIGSGDHDATGADFHLLLRRTDVALDPLATLADIPAELSLAERAYPHFYPYFDARSEVDWKAIFTKAPDQLFAYLRTDTDDDTTHVEVAAGEPVLLDWSERDFTVVRRWDGSSARIHTELVTTDRPATIVLPRKATPPKIDDLSSAMEVAGPEDAKAIAAFVKKREKLDACEYKYLSKHDPTWGTGDDVYKISSNGTVTNVGAEVGAAADRACGQRALDAAGTKLQKALAKTRGARYQAHLAAVRARFGL